MIRETWLPCPNPILRCPFVLLPGLGLSGRYLHRLAKYLNQYAEVWIAEYRGPGAGFDADGFTLTDIAENVADWVQSKNLAPVVLAGHSVGAQVAVEVSVKTPSTVDRLVLITPSIDISARSVRQQLGRIAVDAFREPIPLLLMAAACYTRNGIRAWKVLKAALASPLEQLLPQVQHRTLIIYGRRDPVVPETWAQVVRSLMRSADICGIDAAHGLPYSAWRRAGDEIITFARAAATIHQVDCPTASLRKAVIPNG